MDDNATPFPGAPVTSSVAETGTRAMNASAYVRRLRTTGTTPLVLAGQVFPAFNDLANTLSGFADALLELSHMIAEDAEMYDDYAYEWRGAMASIAGETWRVGPEGWLAAYDADKAAGWYGWDAVIDAWWDWATTDDGRVVLAEVDWSGTPNEVLAAYDDTNVAAAEALVG